MPSWHYSKAFNGTMPLSYTQILNMAPLVINLWKLLWKKLVRFVWQILSPFTTNNSKARITKMSSKDLCMAITMIPLPIIIRIILSSNHRLSLVSWFLDFTKKNEISKKVGFTEVRNFFQYLLIECQLENFCKLPKNLDIEINFSGLVLMLGPPESLLLKIGKKLSKEPLPFSLWEDSWRIMTNTSSKGS